MKGSIFIFVVILFFVYMILCSIGYMMFTDWKYKKSLEKKERLKETFGKEILNHLKLVQDNIDLVREDFNLNPNSEEDITQEYDIKSIIPKKETEVIKFKLKKRENRFLFNEIIREYNKNGSKNNVVRLYMEAYEDVIKGMIKRYKGNTKSSINDSYIINLLGDFRVDRTYINDFLIQILNTKSLYIRYNALKSISKIGNNEAFLEALKYISKTNAYLNTKVFTDIIDQFSGDKNKLNKSLVNNFEEFKLEIQIIIIQNFAHDKYDYVKDYFLEILRDEKSNIELKTNIIRYFADVKYDKAEGVIINLLNDEKWEVRAVAAKALSRYYSNESVKGLLKSITDFNWHVRFNSANSLLKFNLGEELIKRVLEQKDRYSTDILYYAMFEKKQIDYEEYIIKTGKLSSMRALGEEK